MVEQRLEQHESDTGVTPESVQPRDASRDIYTVANVVTTMRLILVPIFFAVLLHGGDDFVAFALFAVAASTDWVDGQIARRTGTVTALGKAIDPLVDRLLIASGVLGLHMIGRLPLWIVALLLGRDLLLLYGAWYLERGYRYRLPVIYIGKVTTAFLMAGFADLILDWPKVAGAGILDSPLLPGLGSQPVAVGMWMLYIGTVLSMTTAAIYIRQAISAVATIKAAEKTGAAV